MITYSEGADFAKEVGAQIFKETSAKVNVGINELFLEIAIRLYKA
jgi:hypothetical protein